MSVAWLFTEDTNPKPKRARVNIQPALSFSDEDKIGTIQPHDDALVVMLGIEGYDVKMVWWTKAVVLRLCILTCTKG